MSGTDDRTRKANLYLALATGLALTLLILVATVYGPGGWRPLATGPVVLVLYLLVNRLILKAAVRPPLVQPGAPVTSLMASAIPLLILLCAGAALLWRSIDFSLGVLVGAILFGQTLESAFLKSMP